MASATLIATAERTHKLAGTDIAALLGDATATDALAAAANRVRESYVGNGVHLRGLIEFSNICRQNCLYCGLRRDNHKLTRYRLGSDEIIALAHKAKRYGCRTVVLQSGEDGFFSVDVLAPILREIKKLDMAITLSLGERSRAEYAALREAGADRYLLRIETTDAALYERLDPGMSFQNRRRCLNDLKELGYEVGTGSLVGLPGQSLKSLADDILFFQAIEADMIGIGPLVPNGDTPLGKAPPGSFQLTRRMVSLLRLLLPEANIPATTAMATLNPAGREIILASGANVFMPNMTEGEPRRQYALYPGKAYANDTPEECLANLTANLKAAGRHIATGKGWRQHNTNLR